MQFFKKHTHFTKLQTRFPCFNIGVRFGELLLQNSTHKSLHFSVLTPCGHIESTSIQYSSLKSVQFELS